MSDDIIDVVDTMELAVMVSDLSDKLDLLRSEVDTIGNVLLQLIHSRTAVVTAVDRGEE